MGRQLLILTALRYEAAAITKALNGVADPPDGQSVRVQVIGPGAIHLRQLERAETGGIIMAGLAGGLTPELAAGDIVIDELSECAGLNLPWRKGKIHSADRIIASPQQKDELFQATGALVVDMESEAARRLAGEWSVPYLGIRSVLDRANESLDPALLRLTNTHGRIRPGRLAAELCRRPAFLFALLQMRQRSAAAMRSLCSAVRQLVQQGCYEGGFKNRRPAK
jgi:adenosylhomocysteine nucleosidase